MRKLIRTFIFAYISFKAAETLVDPFTYDLRILLLLVLAYSLISVLSEPLLKTLPLSESPVTSLLLGIFLNFSVTYAITFLIPGLQISAATTPNLLIFGFMLTSRQLTGMGSLLAFSVIFTFVFKFFGWLCRCKKA